MTTLNEMGDATYIALETFKKNGQGVNTPVWVTKEGNKLFVMTDAGSWKAKRIRNNSRVRVAKSDFRGSPQSDWREAEAHILENLDAWQKMETRMKAKYGYQYRIWALMNRLQGAKFRYVVIEIEEGKG